MENYKDYLYQLPLAAEDDMEMVRHPLHLTSDESGHIHFFRINETYACAVVTGFLNGISWVTLECEVHVRSLYQQLFADDDMYNLKTGEKTYTLKLVILHRSSRVSQLHIPETVSCILGTEYLLPYEDHPLTISDGNPYFKTMNEAGDGDDTSHYTWIYSKDGEDLLLGRWHRDVGTMLDGVRTIHNIGPAHDMVRNIAMAVPDCVKRIGRMNGHYSSVTFEGTLPEFAEDALDGTRIDQISVCTPMSDSQRASVMMLKCVPMTDGMRRSKDDILFASHSTTEMLPEADGYIALTRADFDHDGDTLFVNTSWIATFCPRTFKRSDVDVDGSKLLIGLHGDNDNIRGVCYDVYEAPDDIDEMIACVQKNMLKE